MQKYVWRSKINLILSIIFSILFVISFYYAISSMGRAIDHAVALNIKSVWSELIISFTSVLLWVLFNTISLKYVFKFSNRCSIDLRSDVMDTLLTIPTIQYQEQNTDYYLNIFNEMVKY